MNRILTKLVFPFVAVLICWMDVQGQDARYSQYYASPLRLNPALTGVFQGGFRAGVGYRDQWGSAFGASGAYRTYSVNGEAKLQGIKNDYVGLGVSLMGDRAGSLGYRQMEGHVSASYQKILGKPRGWKAGSSFLSVGAQVGFGQRGVDWNAIQTSLQFDGEGFNPALASGENSNLGNSKTFADVNAGLLWYGVYGHRRSVYAGAAIHHLNQPDISFWDGSLEALYSKITVHGGGEILFQARKPWSLMPAVLLMVQGPSIELTTGTNLKYQLDKRDPFAFKFGLWMRFVNDFEAPTLRSDALIAMAGLEFSNIQLGFSYDTNISNYRAATNGRGAFEVSIVYVNPDISSRMPGCPAFN